ncbi:MAG: helix-turn-helix domain-containing protein [Clostridia bacterium]|nr:helix-turn-helix domain-containing protein [Clostridia bacterium]
MEGLGKALKYQRMLNNYSQSQLADILHIRQSAISKWERGESEPSLNYLIALADLYDISLDELVERDYYGRL